MLCFQLSSDPLHRGTKEAFEEAGDHFSRKPMDYVMPTISRHTQVFIYIQFLGRFQGRYSEIISAHRIPVFMHVDSQRSWGVQLGSVHQVRVYIAISNVSCSTSTLRFVKPNFSSIQYTFRKKQLALHMTHVNYVYIDTYKYRYLT